jgi:hypothetical protein
MTVAAAQSFDDNVACHWDDRSCPEDSIVGHFIPGHGIFLVGLEDPQGRDDGDDIGIVGADDVKTRLTKRVGLQGEVDVVVCRG